MAQFDFHPTSDEAAESLKEAITGKTIIITGVSPNSLGADTARALVAKGPATLILASQTPNKLEEVISSLEIPHGTTVRPLVLDLASLDGVRRAAADVNSYVQAIDSIICTAGVMATPSYQKSKDGFELQFAVNHLGHFLFVNLLMDKLLDRNATVVMYTSEAHTRAKLDFLDDPSYGAGREYEKWSAYSNSKLCNVLFSAGLAQRYGKRNLRSFSVDPGIIVSTALTRDVPQEDFIALGWVDEEGKMNAAIKTKTGAQGSSTGIIAAFDQNLSNEKGYYLADGAMTDQGLLPAASDLVLADKLWKLSEGFVKQSF